MLNELQSLSELLGGKQVAIVGGESFFRKKVASALGAAGGGFLRNGASR